MSSLTGKMEETMKRAVPFAIAVALLASGSSHYAQAQALNENTVRLVHVSRSDLSGSSGKILPTITRGVQEQAQQELNSNSELKSYLANRNVQLNNVVKIDRAANGEMIIYVK